MGNFRRESLAKFASADYSESRSKIVDPAAGEIGRWGDGEMGRWGKRENTTMSRNLGLGSGSLQQAMEFVLKQAVF